MVTVERLKMLKKILYIMFCLTAALNMSAQEDVDYPKKMRQAINNNNLNYALKYYFAALEDDYYDTEQMQRLACEAYYGLGERDKALQLAQDLFEQDEGSSLTDMIYMCCLTDKGRKNDSLIAEVSKKMGENTFDKNILLQMDGLSEKDIDNVAAAIGRYVNDNQINSVSALKPYKTVLTVLFFHNEHYTDAYNSSIDYLTLDSQPVMYYILGVLRMKRQDYESAVSFFDLAVRNGYNHYDVYLQRAICYGFSKDYVRSNVDLDTCLMIDSNYYAFYLKGINYNLMHQYQDAMNCLDYSITLNDTFADSYNYRGIVSSNIKEYAFAVLDFKRAIGLNKKTEFAHNNLGIALEKTGKLQEAIEEYETATRYEPYNPDAYYNLGRVYTDLKQHSKAIRYLKKANDLDPDIPDIYYLLGENYQAKNDKEQACKMYSTALELNHNKAQDKIDNYCNKEDPPKEKKIRKPNHNRRNFNSYEDEDEWEEAYDEDEAPQDEPSEEE